MADDARLNHTQMLEVQQAAISARLAASRAGLMVGLPAGFVASLPQAVTPGEQMLVDLDSMNAASVLTDGTVPLAVWLRNAITLAAQRQEAAVFKRALDQVVGVKEPRRDRRKSTAGHGSARAAIYVSSTATHTKYYLYVSDAKVEMLFHQIPNRETGSLASECGISSEELNVAQTARFARLKIVERYLYKQSLVGTCVAPRAYYSGSLPMFTAIMDKDYVYFGGSAEGRAVALVGSPRHLVGQPSYAKDVHSRIFSAYLMPCILEAFARQVGEDLEPRSDKHRANHDCDWYINSINNKVPGPPQYFEFIAKRLYESDDSLLGTPLYIAVPE